jgi:hypothetical protein
MASATVTTVVLAAIPIASVRTVNAVTPGRRTNSLMANRMSCSIVWRDSRAVRPTQFRSQPSQLDAGRQQYSFCAFI